MKTKNKQAKSRTHEEGVPISSFSNKKTMLLTNLLTRQTSRYKNTQKSKRHSSSKTIKTSKPKAASLHIKREREYSPIKKKARVSLKKSNTEQKGSSKGKTGRQKKLNAYLKAKMENLSQTVALDTTKSLFPLAHEPHSYLFQSQFEQPNRAVDCNTFETHEIAASQMLELNCARNVREFINEQHRNGSQLQHFGMLSKSNWQAFQTLKLKNEELNNCIEELVRVQEKLRAQNLKLQTKVDDGQYQENGQNQESQRARERIAELTTERTQLTHKNAALQELLNETKLQFDLTRNKCLELQSANHLTLQKQKELMYERQQHLNQIQQLSYQLTHTRSHAEELGRRNAEIEQRLRQCKGEKERVRQNAADLLEMVQQMKEVSND